MKQAEPHTHAGALIEERRLSGASVSRIMHPPNQRIDAHGHDWPVLIFCRVGGYCERAEHGAGALDGPGVVFQPAHRDHADDIGAHGLETLTLSFDPAWLSADARAALPDLITWLPVGAAVSAARALAQTWLDQDAEEETLRAQTERFVATAFGGRSAATPTPHWSTQASDLIEAGVSSAQSIASEIGLHPAWLARAYRAWRGEGIAETMRRRRVERASLFLRGGGASLAEIAYACGFCDQSHMNRAFRAVLGRTPLDVRREAALLRVFAAPVCA